MQEKEEFRFIPGYGTRYKISNWGNVIRMIDNHKMDHYENHGKYLGIRLYDIHGKRRNKTIHLLVAMSFLGHQPDGTHRLVVNHIDSNRQNNNVNNLEIITQRQNVIHGYKNRQTTSKLPGVSKSGKKFTSSIYLNKKSYYLGTFEKEEDAAKAYQDRYNEHVKNGGY